MRNFFIEIYRFLIRASAFVGKEMVEVLRQTPLILTLVLGPFLIMLLFGIGYRNEARPLRTLVVMQEGDPLQQQVESLATAPGSIIYEGTVSDKEAALQDLRRGVVDLVVEIQPNALETIRSNQQVTVQFHHNEIDPYQVSYVEYVGSTYINEVNRRILRSYAEQGQESAVTLEQRLANARQRVGAMRQALQAGDALAAQDEQQQLGGEVDAITLLVGGSLGLLNSLDDQTTAGENPENVSSENQAIEAALLQLQEDYQNVGSLQPGQASYQSELAELDQLDSDLGNLETQLKDFQSVEPGVLVTPLRNETVSLHGIQLRPVDFFAPAVIILLLQHLAVTFAVLAIVREQRSGSMELFRISPLSSLEMLLGKYLSYLIFGTILATVISITVVLALKVPMLGTWVNYALVLLTLLFTALGVGFLLSLFAKTEMQAVQYAMFILLGSVFFSGFFLDLRYLWEPVRAISWALPATYAIRLMQNLMLRGDPVNLSLHLALLGIGVLLFILTWLMLRRRLQREWS